MADIKRPKKKKKHKRKSKDKKIILGMFLSLILIIYLVGSVLKLTKKAPLSIEVAQIGTINNNIHIEGMIIRNETVVKSKEEGNIQYLIYEGDKVKPNTPVCMIGNNDEVAKIQGNIDEVNEDIIELQEQRKEFSVVKKDIQNINYQIYDLVYKFRNTYSNKNYVQLYSLKNSIESEIEKKKELLSHETSSSLDSLVKQKTEYENQLANNSNVIRAPRGGIVSYYIDGLEEKINIQYLDKLSKEDLKQSPEVKDVSQIHTAKKGQLLFKVVDNYEWYIAGITDKETTKDWEIGDELSIQSSGLESITIKAKVHNLIPSQDKMILVLQVKEQLTPFISKRNLEFEIIKNNYEGIKIPINSIVEKVFLKVPKKYLQQSGRQSVVIKRGIETDELIPIEYDFEDKDNVYILQDFSSLQLYDTLVLPNNVQTTFTISETQSKTGVFVVNGGIIRFKQISILEKNDEYAIVDKNLDSGIRLYDQIVSNAKNAKENQLINQFKVIDNK